MNLSEMAVGQLVKVLAVTVGSADHLDHSPTADAELDQPALVRAADGDGQHLHQLAHGHLGQVHDIPRLRRFPALVREP